MKPEGLEGEKVGEWEEREYFHEGEGLCLCVCVLVRGYGAKCVGSLGV